MAQAIITQEAVDEMMEYRSNAVNAGSLYARDFQSEEEYRQYLLEEYKVQRTNQYRYNVQNEAMKVYNLTNDGRKQNIHENVGVWTGYATSPSLQDQVSDCAVSRIPEMTTAMWGARGPQAASRHVYSNKKRGTYCCAITSSAIQAQISAKMGYDGKENIIQASTKTSLAYAAGQNYATTASKEYAHDGKGKTLNQLIANGSIGIGDQVSLRIKRGTNNTSGCHAVTIVDIQYDKNGKPQTYTLQANNGCQYTTISVKGSKRDFFGNKKVENYLHTEAYWQDKINQETNELALLDTKELVARIDEEKQKTAQVISDLHETESYAQQHHYNRRIAGAYMQEYEDMRDRYSTNYERINLHDIILENSSSLITEDVLQKSSTISLDELKQQDIVITTTRRKKILGLSIGKKVTESTLLMAGTNRSKEDKQNLADELKQQRAEQQSPLAAELKTSPAEIAAAVDIKLKQYADAPKLQRSEQTVAVQQANESKEDKKENALLWRLKQREHA